jgi:hypothetical protein
MIRKLSLRVTNTTSDYISQRLLLEINFIGGQIYQLWHKYIELLRYFPLQANFILQNDYVVKYKD